LEKNEIEFGFYNNNEDAKPGNAIHNNLKEKENNDKLDSNNERYNLILLNYADFERNHSH